MKYQLPKLNYSYDALEPWIDAKTMEIHYTKHHQGYLDKLNILLEKYPNEISEPLPELLQNLSKLNMLESDKIILKNNGGGHLNHKLFWEIMSPQKEIDQNLIKEISHNFSSIEKFKEEFNKIALNHFGSGWAWLARTQDQKLEIYSTPNQDSPYLFDHTPILGLDVWEHAYYLKYQNRRAEYIQNWWQILKLI